MATSTIFLDSIYTWPALAGFRIIVIVADIALLCLFIYTLMRVRQFLPHFGLLRKRAKKTLTLRTALFEERWREILKKFALNSSDSMRLAVIEADALADEALKQLGLPGEHMADRMEKLTRDILASVDRLWRAHRLRNDLVHSPGFEITPQEAQQALDDYFAFLNEIGAIR